MPLDLDAIAARCAAATRGPWTWHRRDDAPHDLNAGDDSVLYPYADRWDSAALFIDPGDAAFIEHARDDVPALVARVRELEDALQRIAAAEPHAAAMDESDWSHMSGPDTCDGCEGLIRIARAALAPEGGA